MPLAIIDRGTKIRGMVSGRTGIAASSRAAGSSHHATRRAVRTAAMKTAATVFAASAGRPLTAMRFATTMEATATTAVTTTAVLSECWNWHESKTDESSKCKEGPKKIKFAHIRTSLRTRECSFERGAYAKGGPLLLIQILVPMQKVAPKSRAETAR
jgi:hypothetical protein